VTQNLPVLSVQEINAPNNFDRVFTLAAGPSAPTFPDPGSSGRFTLPNGVFTRALPKKQRPPAVDAWNVTVQRQLTDTISLEVAYVGNHGSRVFAGDGPAVNANQATLDGFGILNYNQRQPFFNGITTPIEGLGGAFGWTQGIDYFCNCANNDYNSLQARFTKRFSGGYLANVNYTLQKATMEQGDYFFWDPALNRGPADWDRRHNFVFSFVAQIPVGKDQKYMADISPGLDAIIGGWQLNANTTIQSGLPFSVNYRDAGADRDTGGNNRPDLIGDPDGDQTRDQWFNATPIGSSGSAFGRPARGTFGNMERNALRGPGYWRVDASLFKNIRLGGDRDLQIRLEAVNVFNHVNLGNPDSEVGVPGNNNVNAGRINSTAYGNSDPQRNLQFAVKFTF
jgi:hypothetical protein